LRDKKLNLNEVNETAKKFLPRDYVILVLADTSQFKFNLKGFDKVEIRDFKLNEN
jgi:hypothetical protein